MKHTLLGLTLAFGLNVSLAQDTTVVQTLDFNDITKRRGWYVFPPDTGNVRQVLMYYTLKCDPQTTQDGYDCGEWDYTTLTNLYNYDGVGTPVYSMSGQTPDTVRYMNQAVYDYYQSYQYFPNYSSTSGETSHTVGAGTLDSPLPLNTSLVSSKAQYIYTAAELNAAGITGAGDIHKLELDVSTLGSQIGALTIKMKNSALTQLTSTSYETTGMQEVYQINSTLSAGVNTFNFHTPFNWDGTSNVVVELSFTNATSGGAVHTVVSENTAFSAGVYTNDNNGYLDFSTAEYVEIPSSVFAPIDSFITISFWSYGDENFMPMNSYGFEGRDANGNRVVNTHLPWSNGEVYWDAGNSGGGGYDRVNAAANFSDFAGQWNHWAFVKDVSTGVLTAYLNGNVFMTESGNTRTMNGITNFRIAGHALNGGRYEGRMDEFRIWDAALTQTEIQNYMYRSVDAGHPQYAKLLAAYNFNDLSGSTASDYSTSAADGTLMGLPSWNAHVGGDLYFDMMPTTLRPNVTFIQGTYTMTLDSVMVLDSVARPMVSIVEQSTSIDLLQSGLQYTNVDTIYAWEGDVWTYTFDHNGDTVSSVFNAHDTELINYLETYTHQLQNYVTPYGIGLDLGPNGHRWVYDVTDYLPILHDTLEFRAGNQQELIDVKFLFIEGTPPRDIVDFQTIWTGNYQHANIANDVSMPAVDVDIDPAATQFSLKTRATGHWFGGFENCAEFCPKLHNIAIDGTQEFEWLVWKDCGGNPIVDQGGTWIYDRAGWCPGTFANTYDYDITSMVTPGTTASIDYGMEVTPGGMEGNYHVALQMISYGDINFTTDAAVTDIIAPNNWEHHNRLNPICSQPIIKIQNTGSDTLKSLDIVYRVSGGPDVNYHWTGALSFLEEDTVYLHPMGDWFWFSGNGTKEFEVELSNPNGVTDENPDNNIYHSKFEAPVELPSHFYFWIQANNAASENVYHLIDWDGDTLFTRDNWTNGTTYRDTFLLADGCYTMVLEDRDEDGLSFFANSDGTGYFRWRGVGAGSINTLENNFGDKLIMHFTVGGVLSDDEEIDAYVNVFPNPSSGIFNIEAEGFIDKMNVEVLDYSGKIVHRENHSAIVGGKRFNLDLSSQAKGIYFVRLWDDRVQKIVKLVLE